LWNGEYRKWLHRNIYILSDSQAVIKGFDSFHINSELFGDCHQSPVKLAELHRIQWVWVLGHMGIDGNFIVHQLARQVPHIDLQDLSLPLAYLQRLPGVGQAENMRSTGSPFRSKGRVMSLLKDLLLKELGNYPI